MTPDLNLEAKAYKIMPDTSTVPQYEASKASEGQQELSAFPCQNTTAI